MDAAVQWMAETLDDQVATGAWESHAPLRAAIEDLTADQAAWIAPGARRSVWQITRHVTVWMEYLGDRLAGGPKRTDPWLLTQELPENPEASEAAWRAEIERMTAAYARLRAGLVARSTEDLSQTLPDDRKPLWCYVEVTITHNSYHAGQIRLIRALQGLRTDRW